MEAFFYLFTFGSALFWAALVIISALFIGCIETKSPAWATLWVITLGVLLHKNFDAVSGLSATAWTLIGLGYLVVGGAWSIYKWWAYIKETVQEISHNMSKTASLEKYDIERQIPSAYTNKDTIVMWIAFWPWSAFWTLTHDLFKSIYDVLVNIYNGITKKALAGLEAEKAKLLAPKQISSEAVGRALEAIEASKQNY